MNSLENKVSGILVFPGQGSQFVGMGRSLYQTCQTAKQVFDAAQEFLGYSVLNFDKADYGDTANVQQSLLILEYACYRSLCAAVPEFTPVQMAGHSLGEITALLCAEVLSFADALKLVQLRGSIMQGTRKQGGMLAVIDTDSTIVEQSCNEILAQLPSCYLGVSAYNSAQQLVLSGDEEAIVLAEQTLRANGRNVVRLSNPLAFHSPLMQEAADRFAVAIADIEFKEPKCTVFSNVTAEPFKDARSIKQLIVEQITAPVRWQQIMARLLVSGLPILELGPKNTLSRFVSKDPANNPVLSTDNPVAALAPIRELFNKDLLQSRAKTLTSQELIALIEKTLASTRTDMAAKKEAYQAVKQCLELVRPIDVTQELSTDQRESIKRVFQKALDYKEVTAEKRKELLALLDIQAEHESIKLLCFAYAGGSTQAYAKWQSLLDQYLPGHLIKIVPVEYPGRGSKSKVPLETDVIRLVKTVCQEHEALFKGRYALFGHSLGGAVAYQLMTYLNERGYQAPVAVFVSACPTPDAYKDHSFLSGVSDDQLLENLRSLNGIPSYVYESDDLLNYYLPILKSDVALLTGWSADPIARPGFPLYALGGDADHFANHDVIEAWREFHRGHFGKKIFNGDHFYLNEPEELIKFIGTTLAACAANLETKPEPQAQKQGELVCE